MKKELYITEKTISDKSRNYLKYVSSYHRRHSKQVFKPSRAALLVLDMQDHFLEPDSHAFIPSALTIIPWIQKLILAFSSNNRPVFFTRHINTDKNAGMMARWWQNIIYIDSAYSHITSMLDTSPGKIIQKNQYDAFWKTDLDLYLRQYGVEQVVVSGVMTHLCCETTARSAFIRGFEVFFLVDGTATYTEAHHRASLLNLAHGFALPLLVGDILSQLDNFV